MSKADTMSEFLGNPPLIPLSLGKPSLRIRLEAYYSLIEPSRLQDKTKWRENVEEIYKKYGGSYDGERKLSSKLVKKYGSAVKLLLVDQESTEVAHKKDTDLDSRDIIETFPESWYNSAGKRVNDVNFLSERFNPEYVLLKASEAEVEKVNPWIVEARIPLLDNTLQFAKLLPVEDPLRRSPTPTKRSAPLDISTARKKQRQSQPSHPFDIIMDALKDGPCAVLHKLQRQRVCVVTRYVNSVRGLVTGVLVAFDKHMNLILRDVEESYSPRPKETHMISNVELELERRRKIQEHSKGESSDGWSLKRRRMKQLMLRGDNVVSVYRASEKGLEGNKS